MRCRQLQVLFPRLSWLRPSVDLRLGCCTRRSANQSEEPRYPSNLTAQPFVQRGARETAAPRSPRNGVQSKVTYTMCRSGKEHTTGLPCLPSRASHSHTTFVSERHPFPEQRRQHVRTPTRRRRGRTSALHPDLPNPARRRRTVSDTTRCLFPARRHQSDLNPTMLRRVRK